MKNKKLKITPVKFMLDEDIKNIFNIIFENNGIVRFVGGCIRDLLLKKKTIKDIDLAVNLTPDKIISILDKNNITYLENNALKYGTVTIIIKNPFINKIKKIEITSLRKDIETFGRDAKIEYTDNFEEDARRRDFTINALYADIEGNIYDFVNGYNDLTNKQLHFIGNPEERIKEDFLRILRYFRFYASLENFHIDDTALKACMKNADNLKMLSNERISQELFLILDSKNPAKTLELMNKSKILDKVLFYKTNNFDLLKNLVNIEDKLNFDLLNITKSTIRRLSAVIEHTEESFIKNADFLKLSNFQTKQLMNLLNPAFDLIDEIDEIKAKRILHNLGTNIFQDHIILKLAEENLTDNKTQLFNKGYKLLQISSNWRPLEFCIRGKDVIEKGIPEGKFVGEILSELENWWQNNDFKPEKSELLNELDKIILKHRI